MSIKINSLNNGNVYVNGVNMMGRAAEVSLPEVKTKNQTHEALGLYGELEFPVGLEKLEAKIKWNSYYPEVIAVAGNPMNTQSIQVRSSLEERTSSGLIAEKPVVCYIVGSFNNLPLGTIKKGDPVESETTISVSALKLMIDGQNILEIDVAANIYKVNGQDILANFKSNLGVGQGGSRASMQKAASGAIPGLISM